MKKIYTTLVIALVSINCFGQAPNWAWAKRMGSTSADDGRAIITDKLGNVYTTGSFRGTVDFDPGAGTFNLTALSTVDIYISKLSPSGNFLWAKQISGSGTLDNGQGNSISVDTSDNIYVTGCFKGTFDFDPGAGLFGLTSTGFGDAFITKFSSSGNLIWAKAIGGTNIAYGNSITVDPFGNIYTDGTFQGTADFNPGAGTFNLTSAGMDDIFISKLDNSGNFIWAKSFGDVMSDFCWAIATDAFGNVYTTGGFNGTVDFDPGGGTFILSAPGGYAYIYISKFDSSGNFVWAKDFVGNSSLIGQSVKVDALGNVYTIGLYDGSIDFDPGSGTFILPWTGTGFNIYISKLDSSGNFVWAKDMGGVTDDRGFCIDLDPSGNIYTTGTFKGTADFDPNSGIFNLTSAGDYDVFVSKLDNSGNFIWATSIGGTGEEHCNAITVDAFGSVEVTGYFKSYYASFGSTTLMNADTVFSSQDIFVAKLNSTMGISEMNNYQFNFTISPNPFTSQTTITFSEDKPHSLKLTDLLGKDLKTWHFTGKELKLERGDLKSGIYFLQITDEKNKVTNKKIVIE